MIMKPHLPRRGYKLGHSLFSLMWGAVAVAALGGTLLVLHLRSHEPARSFWEGALLAVLALILSVTAMDIWSVCRREEHLLEGFLWNLKQEHPKGFRIATVWLVWGVSGGAILLLASLFQTPGEEFGNVLRWAVATLAEMYIFWHAVKRTRRILLRTSCRRHGYGK